VPYRSWLTDGHLAAPPGRIIDKGHVAAFVQQLWARHDVRALAFDQAQIEDFQRGCDDIGLDTWIDDGKGSGVGLRMIRHGQGFAGYASPHILWMPRSVAALEEAIVKGRLAIRRNPVLRWNSASAVLDSDPPGNRKWDKRKATGRIDGMVAATMAIGAAGGHVEAAPVSIWDRPDLAAALAPA
jgi:phage terminase large subunit-like protein